MGEQVQQVSIHGRSMVRPAQPSPSHPFFLPCLDIFWQDIHYNRRLVFYERPGLSGTPLMQQLKSSLALCLVHYYPWCGRIAKAALPPHRLFIDCNDAGVEFVEASSELPLSTFAHSRFQMTPFFVQLSQQPDHKGDSLFRSPLLSIQATLFSDGGLVLGIAQSHMVADGQSLWNFMVSWGECSRGVPLSLPPVHDRELLAVRDPSPEKVNNWKLPAMMEGEDKEEEEMEAFAVEHNDKDNVSTRKETLASSGDKVSSSMGTSSTIPHMHVGSDSSSANGGSTNWNGEDPVTQGSTKNGVHKDSRSETELTTNGDQESTKEKKASVGDEPNSDPLVQYLFDLPFSAVQKLKGEAGAGFTSYEVTCAHFWQRVTIARQCVESYPVQFIGLVNCRSRVTPRLSPAYFGNVIAFCVANCRAGKIGSESLCATASRIHKMVAETQEDQLVAFMHWLEIHDNRLPLPDSEPKPKPKPKPKSKTINVASSPHFPAYQVDFGWGTPVAIRPVAAGGEGELILFGGRPGSIRGDMEICTALPDSVLRRLLEDPGFLAKPPCSAYAREEF